MENKTKITIKQHGLTSLNESIFKELFMTIKTPETDEEKEKAVDEIVKTFNELNINSNVKAIKVNNNGK